MRTIAVIGVICGVSWMVQGLLLESLFFTVSGAVILGGTMFANMLAR